MTQIAQGAHVYIFPEPGQVYRVQADDVATVQVIYGAPSAVINLYAESRTFGPYDSPAKLKVSANTAAAEYTLIRAHYAELTPEQLAGGAVGVLGSDNMGGVVEPDGDVPSLGGAVTLPAMTAAATAGTAPEKTAHLTAIGALGNTADAIADTLETAPAADLARIQASVSGGRTAALAKAAKIGVAPLTMSGIGNSIMFTSMPWVTHACALSGGLLQAYDAFHGVPGNGTAQMLARKLEVPAGADLVAIMECTNDADNGTTMAQHEANMRALIEFYLDRGQLPFGCFPPARSDGQPSNIRTFQLGFLDYILFTEYGCPFYFPWRDFVLPDATGGIAPSAGATDNKHPGDDGHRLAGIALWDQMRGSSHVLPLPQSNLLAGVGMVSDPLNLSLASWNKWGDATATLVAESGTPGNWWRLTMTGPTDSGFQRDINIAGVGAQVGDMLMMTCKARTSGAYVNGYALLNLKSGQTYTTILPGMYSKASGINATLVQKSRSDVPTSSIPAGTTSMIVLGSVTADAPAVIELAQIQVWNLSAVRRL